MPPPGPFSRESILPALLVPMALFTLWRPLGSMPRLVFPAWPLFALGMVALADRLGADLPSFRRTVLRMAVLGGLAYGAAIPALLRARAVDSECARLEAQHPELRKQYFLALMYQDICEEIRDRPGPEIHVISPPSALYPVALYEEEPFKIRNLQANLEHHDLLHILSAERLVDGYVFYAVSPGTPPFQP